MKRAPKDAKAALVQDENIASLGMLAAGLAHEINTPVGAIHSNNDILRRAISKLTTLLEGFSPRNARQSLELEAILSVLQQTCQVNETATERIMHVVRNLKDFARLDEAERKKFNIHEGLESTLGIMQHQFKNRIQLVKKYGDVPEIECSPNALNQVFMNILVNAAQAIPERGTITVRTSATETGVEIAISDTGEGIGLVAIPLEIALSDLPEYPGKAAFDRILLLPITGAQQDVPDLRPGHLRHLFDTNDQRRPRPAGRDCVQTLMDC